MRRLLISLGLLSALVAPAVADGGYKFKYVAILVDDQGNETAWQFISAETFKSQEVCEESLKFKVCKRFFFPWH
jgi:hypothetical protein